ncbi:hypothetical protein TSUD_71970 [Trifolium subterraneum]|uniref:Uncharacterized protein n=1 Tax=Trifolium subterraneum TaxID=3900 RepID=A0A2Z6N332_TRISU|nr:hypothetical protein TSUD_71970 [Trifolium subterraneum]
MPRLTQSYNLLVIKVTHNTDLKHAGLISGLQGAQFLGRASASNLQSDSIQMPHCLDVPCHELAAKKQNCIDITFCNNGED